MRQLTSIVACAEGGAIGARNRLPWRLRSDMRFFRNTTLRNVVIMGRKTFASLNGCLPDRRNVVVTHGYELSETRPDCRMAFSIEEALATSAAMARKADEVFVIGGASMYEQFSPFVDRYLVTEIKLSVPDADTYFDISTVSDPSIWDRQVIGEGRRSLPDDEADYTIVEYRARDSQERLEHRQRVIDLWRSRVRRDRNRAAGASHTGASTLPLF